MNLSYIQSHLYSKYNKSEVVVMFDLYGGIRSRYDRNPHTKPFRFFAEIVDGTRLLPLMLFNQVSQFYRTLTNTSRCT